MLIVAHDTAKMIFFRGKGFYISEEDFESLVRYRKERIETGRFYIPNGTDVEDHFASNGIHLEVGGEVCPIEMRCMVNPMSGTRALLDDTFGEKWYEVDGWSADQ